MPILLVAPDKFRGTLTGPEFGAAVRRGTRLPGWEVAVQPLSDGGEGFAAIVAPSGEVRHTSVTGPLGRATEAEWRLSRGPSGPLAVIESAQECGLALAGGPEHNDAVAATTRGVGELILTALDAGASEIVVGCGGSATTDGGRGALEALDAWPPQGLPPSGAGGILRGARLVVACDVRTRFLDAAAVFAPQKGATPEQVALLAAQLGELAAAYAISAGVELEALEGSGAAGGLAGGLAVIGGILRRGCDLVADAVGLDDAVASSDALVTGEGCLDETSFEGKVVGRVLAAWESSDRAGEIPCLIVAGSATDGGRRLAAEAGADLAVLADEHGMQQSLSEASALVADAVATWLPTVS